MTFNWYDGLMGGIPCIPRACMHCVLGGLKCAIVRREWSIEKSACEHWFTARRVDTNYPWSLTDSKWFLVPSVTGSNNRGAWKGLRVWPSLCLSVHFKKAFDRCNKWVNELCSQVPIMGAYDSRFLHPSIIYTYPLRVAGELDRSSLTFGKRRGTPSTGCQRIPGPTYRDKQSFTQFGVSN